MPEQIICKSVEGGLTAGRSSIVLSRAFPCALGAGQVTLGLAHMRPS